MTRSLQDTSFPDYLKGQIVKNIFNDREESGKLYIQFENGNNLVIQAHASGYYGREVETIGLQLSYGVEFVRV